jgi:PAS domain S-box-containing protein
VKRRRPSIGTSVILGALLVAAPFLGLLAWQAYDQVGSTTRTTEAAALARAQAVAADTGQLVDATRLLLGALAELPPVRALDPERCGPVLVDEVAHEPEYANLLLADRSGRVVCSAVPQPSDPFSVADRPWFGQAVRADAFTIGGAQLERVTGRWVAVLAQPVHDAADRLVGVIAAPVDLVDFGSIVGGRLTSSAETITLIDGTGTVLTRVPDPSRWIGRSAAEGEIGPIAVVGGQGTTRARGRDGIERLYGYTIVPGTDWQAFVGIPTAEAFAGVRRALSIGALFALVALAVAIALAAIAGRLIARPVRALAEAAEAAAQGDLSARVHTGGFAETAVLARRFNEMLEQRGPAEAALRASEERLRLSERNLAEAQRIAGVGSWEWDAVRDVESWSDEHHRIFGIEPGTFGGTNEAFLAFVHPDDRVLVEQAYRRAIDEGAPYDFTHRIIRPDGAVRIVHEEAEVVRGEAGNPVRMVGTIQDITEQVAAEQERARLISSVEQTADSIMIQGTDGTITYANPSFARLYGYRPEEVLGRNAGFLDSGRHERSFWSALWASVAAGQTWTGPIVNRRRDGTLVEVESVISAIHDAEGRLTGFIQADRDVTRERQLEAQLRQAQKMEAIGQLAGGIAHDFNNILTAIRGYTELARDRLADADQVRDDLDEVIANADRAAELTRGLLAFSRRQVLQPRVVDPAAIVAGIAPMLRRLLGEQVELVASARPGGGSVLVDPGQLEQVIVNLAVNARDAMPAGGRLTIETAPVELDAEYAATHAEVPPGPYVVLAVSDTGLGMDPETAAHIFEPFFTTKPPGEGTGLGLATVYGIVKQSGGSIYVYSEPGAGTSFKIYLPAVEKPAEPPAGTVPAGHPTPTGSETILLVEDEPAVRAFASRVLAAQGYTVLEAPEAEAALALAATHPGPIELLVTDVVMPGLSGRELAERLVVDRPALRVLYMSGYAENHLGRSGTLAADIAYLPKPFTADALARAVREALDARR